MSDEVTDTTCPPSVHPSERLGHRLIFDSFGLVAELRSDDPALVDAVTELLPPGWRPATAKPAVRFGVSAAGVITVDDAEVHREADHRALLARVGAAIRHHLALHAPAHVFIHAGVVVYGDRAIVIPGPSFSGKTTLVSALVRQGGLYCSDEYAVVDHEGAIYPFAKPLSMRDGLGAGFGRPVTIDKSRTAVRPVRCGVIILTKYRRGARWGPAVLSRSEGALKLLQNTASARSRPAMALSAVAATAQGAVVLAGDRGEASDTAADLLKNVDSAIGSG